MNQSFIIEEFSEYKVFLYDRTAHHKDVDEAILIPFSEGVIHFVFYHEGNPKNYKEQIRSKHNYYIYIPTEKFDRYIDILRHEKPLYVAMDKESLWAYITTELEPVGEGDFDQSL